MTFRALFTFLAQTYFKLYLKTKLFQNSCNYHLRLPVVLVLKH